MPRSIVGAIFAAFVALAAMLSTFERRSSAEEHARPVVLVVPVHGTIDMGLAPFVERIVAEAERENAAAVVLDIDTFGGRLDAAIAIRDRLLASPIRTVAYVHPRAISAGALVSLAASTIAVSEGATIGAATPVQMQAGATAVPVDEKTISYVRKEFRATAEQRHRPVELVEAMVDPDVDFGELAPRGKLLTLTGAEALRLGLAELRADDLPSLLRELDLGDAEVRTRSTNWAERAASMITAPLISSLLMALGMLGLLIELQTPGFGGAGVVGIVCLALFFGGHWIVRLAGFEELLLIGIGVALLALEFFVLPGFGISGIAGIAALLAGLALTVLGSGPTAGAVITSFGRVATSFIVALGAMVLLLTLLPRSSFARHMVLTTGGPALPMMMSPEPARTWVGASGSALTPLRPAGTARIGGARVDVVAEGEFVAAGAAIEVIRQEGNRGVARPADGRRDTRGGSARTHES